MPKGTVGLGLVGAELGLVVPALAGLHDTWAMIVFPILGAGGGAAAGWFLLDDPDRGKGAVAALATGIGLIVPSIIVTLIATRYDPDEAAERDARNRQGIMKGTGGGEVKGSAGGSASLSKAEEPRRKKMRQHLAQHAGGGLVRINETGLLMGLPSLKINPTYTIKEMQQFGLRQATEVHVPLVSGLF